MKQVTQWVCSFWGKHPAFADFIRINPDGALFDALAGWLEKPGIPARTTDTAGPEGQLCHFWIVYPGTSRLMCGVIFSSADSSGRSSPALCTIQGSLPGNPGRFWEAISSYCMASWQDMARLPDAGFTSSSDFRGALSGITPPACKTPDNNQETARKDALRHTLRHVLSRDKASFIREKMLCFPIGGNPKRDEWFLWNQALREMIDVMPCSWFVRDTGHGQHMYLYYRPLRAADFYQMMHNKAETENGHPKPRQRPDKH